MVVVEVGQVVAEFGEVVTDTDPEIPGDIAVHADKEAVFGAAFIHIQNAIFGQRMPL